MGRLFTRAGVLAVVVLLSTGCMPRMVAPQSPQSSMAVIEPILSGSMRVGLAFNTYKYHEKSATVQFMNNYNRVVCADLKNTSTEAIFSPQPFLGATQCYYPNLQPGKYRLTDYEMRGPGEGYRVFFITLYNTLVFRDKNIEFSIGQGEVKHVGRYVIHMKDTGGKLEVQKIDKLDAAPAVQRARQELARTETPWRLK